VSAGHTDIVTDGRSSDRPSAVREPRGPHDSRDPWLRLGDQCGDHPYLDYREVSPRLQQIRGPYTMEAGLAAYEAHLGLTT
jgi:hypothetical protein